MLFINQKCFNTYKNNKKDITHTHTHTLSGRRRSIHDESYRDRGHVISTATTRLLHALLVASCHSSGLRSFPVMLCSDWKRKQSALQTGCSLTQSVHHFRLCVSWFKACWWFFTAVHSSDQSIPPMSCCLLYCETRVPAEEHRYSQTDTSWTLLESYCFSGMTLNAILFSLTYKSHKYCHFLKAVESLLIKLFKEEDKCLNKNKHLILDMITEMKERN